MCIGFCKAHSSGLWPSRNRPAMPCFLAGNQSLKPFQLSLPSRHIVKTGLFLCFFEKASTES